MIDFDPISFTVGLMIGWFTVRSYRRWRYKRLLKFWETKLGRPV